MPVSTRGRRPRAGTRAAERIGIAVTTAERRAIEAASQRARVSLSEWVRVALAEAADVGPADGFSTALGRLTRAADSRAARAAVGTLERALAALVRASPVLRGLGQAEALRDVTARVAFELGAAVTPGRARAKARSTEGQASLFGDVEPATSKRRR